MQSRVKATAPAESCIFLPLNQAEMASQPEVDQLLPLRAYERITSLIQDAIPHGQAKAGEQWYLEHRIHNAVLVDGKRGSGKSTVIVNLQRYLKSLPARDDGSSLAGDVHIFRPIDPAQLEDDDDLLLNVVVAAVLTDPKFKAAQDQRPESRNLLHTRLQALGKALEGRQAQSDVAGDRGLDRLRNFVGSQGLAQSIHDFFAAAAEVLGKKLLVMPIDDVDTTMHRAYENLEIVRRYLATPVVLPVLCGELRLFEEVIWRDIFGRLARDGSPRDDYAKKLARELAHEYQRKVLPLRSRVQMPELQDFLRDERILLGTRSEADRRIPLLSLPQFHAWLHVMLAGPVNGLESSALPVPLHTVRSLAQLVSHLKELIPELARMVERASEGPVDRLLRRVQLITAGREVDSWTSTRLNAEGDDAKRDATLGRMMDGWRPHLLDHFRYEPAAGAAVLTLMAGAHWRDGAPGGALSTPLFVPLQHATREDLKHFDRTDRLAWREFLEKRLPESWLNELPEAAILPFPVPEPGQAVRSDDYRFSEEDEPDDERRAMFDLVVEMVLHRDYYAPDKRAPLICIGRVIELVVASLVHEVAPAHIERLLAHAPFHSASAVATTTTLTGAASNDERDDDDLATRPELDEARKAAVEQLAEEIKEWRSEHRIRLFSLSPWLTYNAIVKVLNQARFFNAPREVGAPPREISIRDVAQRGRVAFNALWAAFGSYEKGPLFGLPAVTSKVNVLGAPRFLNSDPYRQNIRPFRPAGARTRDANLRADPQHDVWTSVTRLLIDHPLRRWLEKLPASDEELAGSLRVQLEIETPSSESELTQSEVRRALLAMASQRSIDPQVFGSALLQFLAAHKATRRELELLAAVLEEIGGRP